MIKPGPTGSSMMHIMRHFRLISFFCFFIIVITYFLMYLNYEKVNTITCNEYERIFESNSNRVRVQIGSPTKNSDSDKMIQIQGDIRQKVNTMTQYQFVIPSESVTKQPLSNSRRYDTVDSVDEVKQDISNVNYKTKSQHFDEIIRNSIQYEKSTWQMKQDEFEHNQSSSVDEDSIEERSSQVRQGTFENNIDSSINEARTKNNHLQMKQNSFNDLGASNENSKFGSPSRTPSKLAFQNNRNIPVNEFRSVKERKMPPNKSGDNSDVSVDELSRILNDKIRIASSLIRKAKTKPGCVSNDTIANSCDDDKCLRMAISEDPKKRISELVTPNKLQLSYSELSTLVNMRNKVSGIYDTILLTAASSNHFLESQALLKNLHEHIYPHLKNFLLIYYNIGLSLDERKQLVQFCNCTVVDFPFDEVPEFVRNLQCYSWKPLIIKAHIEQGNVVAWLDSSVRFRNIDGFKQIMERTKVRGFQMAGPSEKSPFRTVRSMYHFFGDEPCAYLQMGQLHATSGFFKRDPFVNRAILEPWVACALNKNCMCPANVEQKIEANKEMSRKWREEGGPIVYGQMHRYDQSAISLIIHKLFYKYYPFMLFDKIRYGVEFLRRDTAHYFPLISTDPATS